MNALAPVRRRVSIGGRSFVNSTSLDNWWLLDEGDNHGLDGWDDSAPSKTQFSARPDDHGSDQPVQVLLDNREVTIYAAHAAASHYVAEAEVKKWAAALAARGDLTLEVTDASGTLSARCWVSSQVQVRSFDAVTVHFQITVTCPDPRKYGPWIVQRLGADATAPAGLNLPVTSAAAGQPGYFDFDPFSTEGGFGTNTFKLANPGLADTWVIFAADGVIPGGISITSEGQELRLERDIDASGDPDRAALILAPTSGGRAVMNGVDVTTDLVVADWMSIPAETTRQFHVEGLETPLAGAYVSGRIRGAWW